MKQFFLLSFFLISLKLVAQNHNAMVCKATRDNTLNSGTVPPIEPGKIIKDYFYFTVNIDSTKIKTFKPKFVFINCDLYEGNNENKRYKLPLIIDSRKTNCENSILDKYGNNILLRAEREIYKQGKNSNDKIYLEQKIDNKYEGNYLKYPAILEVEINGQLEVLYCTLIDYLARP